MNRTFSGIILPVKTCCLHISFLYQSFCRLIYWYATWRTIHLILNWILIISKIHFCHTGINNWPRLNICPFCDCFQAASLPDITSALRMITFIFNGQIPICEIMSLYPGIIIIFANTLYNQKSNIVRNSVIIKTNRNEFICSNILSLVWTERSENHCSKGKTGLQLLVHIR